MVKPTNGAVLGHDLNQFGEPLCLADLISGGWKELPFRPFRDGIEISEIITGSPAVAAALSARRLSSAPSAHRP